MDRSDTTLDSIISNIQSRMFSSGLSRGLKRNFLKTSILTTVPAMLLVGMTLFYITDSVTARRHIIRTTQGVRSSAQLSRLVHSLERERDQSILYVSSVSPQTKTYLLRRYIDTNINLELIQWPSLTKAGLFYASKRSFSNYLQLHRSDLELLGLGIFDEMAFYTGCIKTFIEWIYDTLNESKYNHFWKSLVAYLSVMNCIEEAGIERALGTFFISNGGFASPEQYHQYMEHVNHFHRNYDRAIYYSELVKPMASYKLMVNGENVDSVIGRYRDQIGSYNTTSGSFDKAIRYFDVMTQYLDQLVQLHNDIEARLIQEMNNLAKEKMTPLMISITILVIVVVVYPFLIVSIWRITYNIQKVATELVEKRDILKAEKRQVDEMLYQMLPRSVVDKIRCDAVYDPEYFRDVTVFFSDIAHFSRLATMVPPIELISFIDGIYSVFDQVIDRYNLYKVETIADTYMVTSGINNPCMNHASEIANFALDIMQSFNEQHVLAINREEFSLRIGIHSGPVMAGIIGTTLPRYRIYGDTVNTASRMQTNASGSSIQISSQTFYKLTKAGGFVMESLGSIPMKGKGQMKTYLLLAHADPTKIQSNPPGCSKYSVNTVEKSCDLAVTDMVQDISKTSAELINTLPEICQALRQTQHLVRYANVNVERDLNIGEIESSDVV